MPTGGWRLSKDARRDLRGVALYTRRRWGPEQTDHYRVTLEAAFDRLAAYPQLGRDRGDLRSEILVFLVEQHLVVYRADMRGVLILRVIHQMMDLDGLDLS